MTEDKQLSKFTLFLKVVVWRVVSTTFSFFINFLFTGEFSKSIAITIATSTFLMFLQWFFEIVWNKQTREKHGSTQE
jgi:uncharacterized membrane protein